MARFTPAAQGRPRDLLLFRNPGLWKCWPFLPVVRRTAGGTDPQLGVLFDAVGTHGPYGYSATVFLTDLFCMPRTLETFLALPRCVYDTADELAEAGWTVDARAVG